MTTVVNPLFKEYNRASTILVDRHHNHRSPWATEFFHEVARLAPGPSGCCTRTTTSILNTETDS
jgi:hypothetical protein